MTGPRADALTMALRLFLGSALGAPLGAGMPLVEVQLNLPQGGLRSLSGDRPGVAFGIQGEADLDGSNRLRPRMDLSFHPQLKLSGIQNTASSLSAGCDLLHGLGRGEGAFSFYLVGGLSAVRWGLGSGDTTHLGVSAGVGARIQGNWNWECRYSVSPLGAGLRARSFGMGAVLRL